MILDHFPLFFYVQFLFFLC